MFDVLGADIERLSDSDLRSLVVRLATSELRRQGLPLASVTAGGHQDAADGGLDVRVDCPAPLQSADFVPRQLTGFQVKRPDMPANAIREEMRPKGSLRPVIVELSESQGAYVIVSAQGSVADKPLRERRQAMRNQLTDLTNPENLYTDFYDRERLATWVNEYPGIAAWVRTRANRPLDGWSSVDRWVGSSTTGPFLTDASTCLVDESRKPSEALSMLDGVQRLRSELQRPGRCVRLIGLSGLGKTRLVQALFETGVGSTPLDPGLAMYTDYATDTRPSARDMARDLIGTRQPAILIVDNCNPETHSELASLCFDSGAPISLLTVEYDVREDEPEHTDVFRLQAASKDLLEEWLEHNFRHVSQVDRRTIAEFSHGNFRVARALAETVKRGETLGQVRSRDLFQRIFRQRNSENTSLLMSAEDLALAYSVDGEDIAADGELARLASIRGIEARQLFEAISELKTRDVAQARGRWRAILPQAIANGLAANALSRIHPSILDNLVGSAGPRLRISISRRLGNLHDSKEAQDAAKRWLEPDGAMGDLFADHSLRIVTNLAPIAPSYVLERIRTEVDLQPDLASMNASYRWSWIRLIKALGYDPECFVLATFLLVRFIAMEPERNNNNSARESFAELFHLHLSGTEAPPDSRREVVSAMLSSVSTTMNSCGLFALEAMLKTSYFSSTSNFDFGARSRTSGWKPSVNGDVWDWYTEAIRLCASSADRYDEVRRILSGSVRGLWHYPACHDALEDAANTLHEKEPWTEGWIALRATLRFDGDAMPPAWRERLVALIDRLKPIDLLHRARAAVLGRGADGWDVSDGEGEEPGVHPWERAARMAEDVGRELAVDNVARHEFMTELMVAPDQQRAFECGIGLGDGAASLDDTWDALLSDYEDLDAAKRNPTVIGGYLKRGHDRDPLFAQRALDASLHRSSIVHALPFLQARVGIDSGGIERLRQAIAAGSVSASAFAHLANGVVEHSPPEPLSHLITELASLPSGDVVALDILRMYFFSRKATARPPKPLLEAGRRILGELDLRQISGHRAYAWTDVIKSCLSGKDTATSSSLATSLHRSLAAGDINFYDVREVVKAICEVQPQIVLDVFLLTPLESDDHWRWDMGGRRGLPYRSIGSSAIRTWASVDPTTRFALLGSAVPLFSQGDFEEGTQIEPLFEDLLRVAPHKTAFLGSFQHQVHPNHWSGSLEVMLESRRSELLRLAAHFRGETEEWVRGGLTDLDRWISNARDIDQEQEESFE